MNYYFFIESYFNNAVSLVLEDIRTEDDAINLYGRVPFLYDEMVTLSIKVFGDYPIDDFLVFINETINVFALRRSWQYNRDIWYLNLAYGECIYRFIIGMFKTALAANEIMAMRHIFITQYYKYMEQLPEPDKNMGIMRAYAKYWRMRIYED